MAFDRGMGSAATASTRRAFGALPLEVWLAGGVLGLVVGGVPLGLDRVAQASAVAAGLTLGGADPEVGLVPPLVVVLVRLAACLPIGDVATRANFVAALLAAGAAVLLARLGQRILRGILPGPVAEPVVSHTVETPAREATQPRASGSASRVAGARSSPTLPRSVSVAPVRQAKRGAPASGLAVASERRLSGFGDRRIPGTSGRKSGGGNRRVQPAGQGGRGPVPRHPVVRAEPDAIDRDADIDWRAAAPAPARVVALPVAALPPLGGHQLIALVAAVVCPIVSLTVFLALSSSPASALSLCLVAATWLRVLGFELSPGTPRRGLALSLLAGLALGADPVTPLFVWPPVLVSGLRWWRAGERWPAWAPLAFLAGAAIAAGPLLAAGAPGAAVLALIQGVGARLLAAVHAAAVLGPLGAVAREALGQLGVVAGLIAAVGGAVWLGRRPRWFLFAAAMGALALALVASDGGPPRFAPAGVAFAVLLVLAAAPLLIGVAHLAEKLGPARGAAALTLAVVAVLPPLLDGGGWRFRRGTGLPEALLERVESRLEPGVAVLPGSDAIAALLRYGRALDRRPDLVLPSPPSSVGAPAASPPQPPVAAR